MLLSKPIRVHLKREKHLGVIGAWELSRQLPSPRCSFTTMLFVLRCTAAIIDLDPRYSISLSFIIWHITIHELLTPTIIINNNWFSHPHIIFRLQFSTRSFKRSPEFDSFWHNSDFLKYHTAPGVMSKPYP